MSGYILHEEKEDLVLPAEKADRLLSRGDGDAALLYLCLLRMNGGISPQELMKRLGWSELRLANGERVLQEIGLLQRRADSLPPERAEERPEYSRTELADMLEGDAGFRMLVPQVEKKLGKELKTADLQILAGLYDDLGLPADVIFLLVNHCLERSEKRYGPGRRPTLRQIEKEGYYWARLELFTQDAASAYLRQYHVKQGRFAQYMQVLQLGARLPVESEEKYISDWIDKGFSPEAVALAYDKTVFYKKELNWRYLNGILRRWDERGCHTPEEIARMDAPRSRPAAAAAPSGTGKNDWMKKYIKR